LKTDNFKLVKHILKRGIQFNNPASNKNKISHTVILHGCGKVSIHSVQLNGTPHSIPSVIAVVVGTGVTDAVVEKKLVVVSVSFCEVVLAIY
jgi:hypothetical protein